MSEEERLQLLAHFLFGNIYAVYLAKKLTGDKIVKLNNEGDFLCQINKAGGKVFSHDGISGNHLLDSHDEDRDFRRRAVGTFFGNGSDHAKLKSIIELYIENRAYIGPSRTTNVSPPLGYCSSVEMKPNFSLNLETCKIAASEIDQYLENIRGCLDLNDIQPMIQPAFDIAMQTDRFVKVPGSIDKMAKVLCIPSIEGLTFEDKIKNMLDHLKEEMKKRPRPNFEELYTAKIPLEKNPAHIALAMRWFMALRKEGIDARMKAIAEAYMLAALGEAPLSNKFNRVSSFVPVCMRDAVISQSDKAFANQTPGQLIDAKIQEYISEFPPKIIAEKHINAFILGREIASSRKGKGVGA